MMLNEVNEAPPVDPSVGGSDDVPDLEVTLEGHAAARAAQGARLAGLSRGDFVIDATMSATALGEWEAAGFRLVARDPLGREFDLTPAIYGIRPPAALLNT